MTTPIDTFPDYREIDAPWDTQPIAWRFNSPDAHKKYSYPPKTEYNTALLTEQASNPALTHLVREVIALTDQNGQTHYARPVHEVRDELKLVDDQFAQYEDLTDIKVAPTEWHVFKDSDEYTRVLARVGIIEGEDREWPDLIHSDDPEVDFLTPEEYMFLMGLESGIRVYTSQARGRRLIDVESLMQYKLGVPRTNLMSQQAFFLIDIEPRLMAVPQNV